MLGCFTKTHSDSGGGRPFAVMMSLVAFTCCAAQGRDCPLSRAELDHDTDYMTHAPSTAPRELSNCTWYESSTCCTLDDTLRISDQAPDFQLTGSTRECRDAIHLLMCSVCSPSQREIFVEETIVGFAIPVLRVCESFCEMLHTSCGSASLLSASGPRDRVDVEFEDGLAFCRAVGLRTVLTADRAACFSSATSWNPRATLAATAAAFGVVAQVSFTRMRQ